MLGFRHVAAAAGGEFVLNITANAVRPDIHALAVAAGWNGATRLVVNITAAHINTIDWLGAYPAGRRLIIRGRVGSEIGGAFAIRVNSPIEIENYGQIWARGGRGGMGGTVRITYNSDEANAPGGVGGAGAGYQANTTTWINGQDGEQGATVRLGPSVGPGTSVANGFGGEGGGGGGAGGGGSFGTPATVSGTPHSATYTPPQAPLSGGVAVSGSSFVTWIAQGTIAGSLS